MSEIFTTYNIIIAVLVAFSLICIYIIRNLLLKLEKYEDVTSDQTQYLQNISNTIREGRTHLDSLDERGVFQSDDEVGTFFKYVQDELNRYMLPENYGKEEVKS